MSTPKGSHRCPHCDADLRGPEIDRKWIDQGFYEPTCSECGGPAHYVDEIGVVVDDRVTEWRCPACGGSWIRAGVRFA